MDKLFAVLRAHAARYPLMEPRDAVKLIYQNEFGGGHLIHDRASALQRIRIECRNLRPADGPLLEDIGNGLCRLELAALSAHSISQCRASAWFCDSAPLVQGAHGSLLKKLALLRRAAEERLFGFDADALETYLRAYAAAGFPMVSHSDAYRAAYAPAYRVVLRSVTERPCRAEPGSIPL